MPQKTRQAGQNIRTIEVRRRVNAIMYFVSAVFVSILPFFVARNFENLLRPLFTSQQSSLTLPPYFYVAFFIPALGFFAHGIFMWKRANHAAQGAQGEENIAQEIYQLEQEGWEINYGILMDGRRGDIDIVCISPQRKTYVIDVKSHKGIVKTDGKRLYRYMGKKSYPFEKNFLNQVMKQALQIKQQRNLDFVTPIVAFSNAKVLVPPGKIKNVYVVERLRLVPLLRSLG